MKSLQTFINKVKNISNKGVTFINTKEEEHYYSYQSLYQNAIEILGYLQAMGIPERAQIVTQIREDEDFVPLVWAGFLGNYVLVPMTPADKEEDKLRLKNVYAQLDNSYLVSVRDLETVAEQTEVDARRILYVEDYQGARKQAGKVKQNKGEDMALVMYTSGSTGNPKGVTISHLSLAVQIEDAAIRYQTATRKEWDEHKENVFLTFMPLTHMLGFSRHFIPVVTGEMQYVMAINLFMKNPFAWMDKTHEHRVTSLCAPNFSLKFFTTALLASKNTYNWDLSCVSYVSSTAEPICREVVEKFLDVLEKYHLRRDAFTPMYGMTESTCWITSQDLTQSYQWYSLDRTTLAPGNSIKEVPEDDENAVSIVSVGMPVDHTDARVMLNGKQLGDRQIGILEFKGDGMTRGYYRNDDENKRAYTGDGFLITGDLCFMDKGHIILTGRAKDMLIANGQNYYANDIERVAMELGEFPICAVFGVMEKGESEEQIILCAKYTKSSAEFEGVARKISDYVRSRAGLTLHHIVQVPEVPVTRSGKVQRAKMKEIYLDQLSKQAIPKRKMRVSEPPKSRMEKKIAAKWREILDIEDVGRMDNFYELGGNSLHMNFIIAHLRKENIQLSIKYFMEHPTIRELAKAVEEKKKVERVEDVAVGDVPPIINRELLYVRNGMKDVHHWNIGKLLEVNPLPEKVQIEKAVRFLMEHHDCLRMRYWLDGVVWKQRVEEQVGELPISYIDLSSVADRNKSRELDKAIDQLENSSDLLENPVHFAVIDLGEGKPGRVYLIAHHAIVDGYGVEIFQSDFITVYTQVMSGKELTLPPKTTSMRRWCQVLDEYAQSDEVKEEFQQWIEPIGKIQPFPVDYPEDLDRNYYKYETVLERELLSKKESDLLFYEILDKDIHINDVLITALTSAVGRWSGNNQAYLDYTFNGRYPLDETIDLSRTIGWMAFQAPVLFEYQENDDIMDIFEAVRNRIRKVKNGALGYGCLRMNCKDDKIRQEMNKIPYPELMYNFYKFDYEETEVKGDWGYIKQAKEFAGQNEGDNITRGRLVDFIGVYKEEKLVCKIQYCSVLYRQQTMETLYIYVKEELKTLLARLKENKSKEETIWKKQA